jgi:stearoyl-CoA desaturase (delta-9 desaturase)
MATLVSETPAKPAATPAPVANEASGDSASTQQRSDQFNWVFFVIIAIFHLLAAAAIAQSALHWRWSSVVVFCAVWLLGQNVGIGMSYHRQLTHRGYATPKWLEYLMAGCGTMALQGGPLYWVAVHRMHHQYTDKPGDPHSPRDGAWWSHMGWILNGSLHNESKVLSRYAPDLAKDPVHQWLSKYHWLPVTAVGVVLLLGGAAFGGWGASGLACGISWALWGVFLRVTIGMHVTWLVNSATHMWGSQRFKGRDDSTNNWVIALLTGGEGWHNNHHAHPVSARHGMAWYEIDFNYMGIQLLKLLGLAKNVYALDAKTALAKSQAR